jgi:DNA ligase-1
MMAAVLAKGGEGIMLRKPHSYYERGRSGTIFKLKDFVDEEATVIGYEEIEINTPGKSHLKGAMGALFCLSKDGKKFKIGSGFTDAQRLNPPKIGAQVTFKYQELTAKGIPRHPRFVAERNYE